MLRVGFEPTIPVFERAETVHASDRAATVIGKFSLHFKMFSVKLSTPTFCGILVVSENTLSYDFRLVVSLRVSADIGSVIAECRMIG
jgi:hypothetical protein